MSFSILGLGTANPACVVTREESLACARVMGGPPLAEATWVDGIYANSGVATRHQVHGRRAVDDLVNGTCVSGSPFVPAGESWTVPSTATRMRMYAEHAGPMAVEAARKAVEESGVSPGEFTHLVTVSCTGFAAPGVELALIRELGLRPTVLRTNVGFMGCHAAINGLRVAAAFAADPTATVLMVAVELCSLHYYFGDAPDKVIANALFADGAAAVVGRGGKSAWSLAATGSCLLPNCADAMGWTVGDFGFEMSLSRHIPRLIGKHLRPWVDAWLADNGLTVAAVGSWAIHPGGPRILSAAEEALGVTASVSREVFSEFGNMSSPTVLFILDRLRTMGAPRPCVMLGFGPGLVAEAALVM